MNIERSIAANRVIKINGFCVQFYKQGRRFTIGKGVPCFAFSIYGGTKGESPFSVFEFKTFKQCLRVIDSIKDGEVEIKQWMKKYHTGGG